MSSAIGYQGERPVPKYNFGKPAKLLITERRFCDVVIFDCSGRLVVGNHTEQLFEAVRTAMDSSRWLLVNLSGVSAVDSGGLGILVLLHRFADAGLCDLKICSLPRHISDLLHLTGLHMVLDVHANEDRAIESFYRTAA